LTWHAPFVGFPVAQKEIAGRLESGTQRWEDEREWRAKRDGSLPRDHACRRQQPCLALQLPASAMNGDFGTSPPNGGRPSDESAQLISHQRAWQRVRIADKSKDCCHLSNAAAPLPRFTMFLAGTAARPCAATSRRDVPRSWRLPRLQRDSRERPRSPLAAWVTS
jgi:hypothetical protein